MSLLDLLLFASILLAVVYMGFLSYREVRKSMKATAFGLFLAGAALLMAQGSQFLVLPVSSVGSQTDTKKYDTTKKKSVILLDPRNSSLIGESIDLNKSLLSDKWNLRSELKGGLFILDASNGILPENKVVLETIFNDIKLEPAQDKQTADVCWMRHTFFTMATGVCEQRSVKWLINPSQDDLTRTQKSFSTVRVAEHGASRWVIVTHSIPVDAPSAEEQCLLGLSKGLACASVEVLPSAATAALYISTTDLTIQTVLEEFAAAIPKDLNEGLAMYSTGESPLLEKVSDSNTENFECGGIFLNPEIRLKTLVLDSITAGLREADTESKLAKEAKNLTRYLNCPGLSQLLLPKFKRRDLKISARSFMTHAMKHAFWFTDDKSYLNRLSKIQEVSIQTDDSQQKVALAHVANIKGLSLSFVLPTRYPEEMLQSLNVVNPGSDWSVYRMGSYAFRISLDKAADNAVIDLTSFFQSLQGNQLGFTNFLGSVGVLPSLQLAFILAVLLTFVHVTASAKPVMWIFTFAPVALITFILVFLSIISSRLPSGNDTSLAQMENPALPQHLFLRDWPDQWFERSQVRDAEIAATSQRQSEKWAKALRDGSKVTATGDQNSLVLGAESILHESIKGSRRVVVWDYPPARNFYFRKSSAYQSLILGWREIASANDSVEISLAGQFDQLNAQPKNSVVIIPDIRFFSDSDLASLDQFVKAGGLLVFSEKIESEEAGYEFKIETGFTEVLRVAGLQKSSSANYSKVSVAGLNVSSLNVAHRILKPSLQWVSGQKWGAGAAIFLGVQPLDSQSRILINEIVSRLQGKQISVPDLGEGCATAIFLQPWGTSTAELDAFSRSVRQAGYDLRWLLDPISLAKMAPQWESRLRADGVVFLDDGKATSRSLASELIKTLQGPSATPVFVLSEGLQTISNTDVGYQASIWKSECRLGLAKPRFLTGVTAGSLNQSAQVLKKQGPKAMLGFDIYLERLQELRTKNTSGDKKLLKYNIENPLELTWE
jgi:hypothetical protein